MSRRRGNSIIDRALALACPDPAERARVRDSLRSRTPHERDEIRRRLAEAFDMHDARRRAELGLPPPPSRPRRPAP